MASSADSVAAPARILLGDGRILAYDDGGDPAGTPVVYLHGTPDSRRARHPDDGIAARAGVRLLALDRPGYGGTSPSSPGAAPDGFAADLARLLDELGIDRVWLLAWSGGALDGMQAAASAALAGRVASLTVVGGLVPCDAYTEPEVRAAAGGRLDLLDFAAGLAPGDLAAAVAPLLAPYPCDFALALEHQREQRSPADQAALEAVPGAVERMAEALVEAVRTGLAGVEADVRAQVQPFGAQALDRVETPVRLLYGSADSVTPPAFGAWYARHLPHAELDLVEGAGHYLPLTHWPAVLALTLEAGAAPGTGPPG